MSCTNENVITHNDKEYRFAGDNWGYSLDHCIRELQKKAIMFKHSLWFIEFNSHTFYSDEVTLDSAYKEVLGKTYGEYIDERNKKAIETEIQDQIFKMSLPTLRKDYEQIGKKIVDKKYYKKLEELIPDSLEGIYKGWDLTQAFEIVKMLNNESNFEECETQMNIQSHSGFSFGITTELICELCDRGPEFKEYIFGKYIRPGKKT